MESEICCMAAMLSSFEEVSKSFEDKGIHIGINTVRNIAKQFAFRAQAAKKIDSIELPENLNGRRVVVSTDGGRIRIRKNKRGPRTPKGRSRYKTDWREPKLLIIYVVDQQGKADRCFSPYIETTLKGPDAVFGLISYYLKRLQIDRADQVMFIADGARWIWIRFKKLVNSLNLAGRIYQLVDFYHAVEHLGKVAELKKAWQPSDRKRWIKKHRRLLLKGHIDRVIAEIKIICRGRISKKLARERTYFIRNKKRMNYKEACELKLPIGSGAVESAIRRVINLRLKGASIYWLEEMAEAMLMLRSYYKAGRWNNLKLFAFSVSFGFEK
jgi:hypothetical protein